MKAKASLSPDTSKEHLVILGNGIAGITLARHVRKRSNRRITVISAESDYFFSRTALMYVYMGHMRWKDLQPYEQHFWKDNRIELMQARVTEVDAETQQLQLDSGESLSYDQLVLATGSIPRKLGWEGQELKGVQGLVSKQDLELLEKNSVGCTSAVIVGGGLIGVELAEMLHTRNIKVNMLLRESGFWGNVLPASDASFIAAHLRSHGINLLPETQLQRILGDETGKVKSILTDQGQEIPCQLVGLSIGVRPNIEFLKDSSIETGQGILVDSYFRTNIPNIFAIGDCAELKQPPDGRPSIEAVWYTARMMGETLAQTLTGNPMAYSPGHWFNSAKFFDIEYQTYGRVWASPKEEEEHFHWEDQKRALTIAYHKNTRQFLGLNSFGIRLRHEVCDRWLREAKTIDQVLKHFGEANFDPEFYKKVKF